MDAFAFACPTLLYVRCQHQLSGDDVPRRGLPWFLRGGIEDRSVFLRRRRCPREMIAANDRKEMRTKRNRLSYRSGDNISAAVFYYEWLVLNGAQVLREPGNARCNANLPRPVRTTRRALFRFPSSASFLYMYIHPVISSSLLLLLYDFACSVLVESSAGIVPKIRPAPLTRVVHRGRKSEGILRVVTAAHVSKFKDPVRIIKNTPGKYIASRGNRVNNAISRCRERMSGKSARV